MNTLNKSRTERDERIIALCKRVWELYGKDLRRLTKMAPVTIKRCAEGTNVLRDNNAESVAPIISVRSQSLHDYYDGKITLDELWDRRGEASPVAVSYTSDYDSVLYSVKNLSLPERIMIAKEVLETINVSDSQAVKLSKQSKTRLKTIVLESLKYGKLTVKDLIEKGVNQPAITDIAANDFERDYTEDAYLSILPYLFKVSKWIDDETMITDYPNTFDSIQELYQAIAHE